MSQPPGWGPSVPPPTWGESQQGWGQPTPGWGETPAPATGWGERRTWATPAAAVPGWGHPQYGQPAWVAYGSAPTDVVYAGFWRRWWGLVVDGLVVNVATTVWALAVGLATRLLVPALRTCEDDTTYANYIVRTCRVPSAVIYSLLALSIGGQLYIWYRLIPRRMGIEQHTAGQRQLGLRVIDVRTGGVLGAGTAFARAIIAGLLQVAPLVTFGLLVFVVGSRRDLDDVGASQILAALAVFVALTFVPALWSLFDPRRQTLYDKAVGSAVLVDRPVCWFSVSAFGSALLMVFPLAIVLGHIGVARTSSDHHKAGGGLAVTGLLLGYLELALVVLVFALGDPGS